MARACHGRRRREGKKTAVGPGDGHGGKAIRGPGDGGGGRARSDGGAPWPELVVKEGGGRGRRGLPWAC
jgi:hypothetical protein